MSIGRCPNFWGIKYFDLLFRYNHLLTKLTIYVKFKRNWKLELYGFDWFSHS